MRVIGACAIALALWAPPALADEVPAVTVGGTAVQVGAEAAYRPVSAHAPVMFSLMQAGLPATHRLVEAYVSEGDLTRAVLGQQRQDPMFQVQVLRDAEHVALSAADWQQARPQIVRSVGAVDTRALADAMQDASAARVSEALGAEVGLRFGEIGRAVLYGEDPRSVRFVMLMPMQVQVAGQAMAATLECAGAVARVGDRLLFLYAFREHVEGADTTAVRNALDGFVERTLALNSGS